MNRILVVDDEKNMLSSFKKILAQDGYQVLTANHAQEALSIAKSQTIDLTIMDIRMPGMTGLDAFTKLKEIDYKIPVILMTAFGTTETAIEAMRLGAYDYVIKPFDVREIKKTIEEALEVGRIMRTEVTYEPKEPFKGDRIVGSSFNMQQVYKLVGSVTASDVTVLLRGESGTGKELIARAIYHHSKRKDKSFLIINSAAIPDSLLESELFGYEKGAFTDAKERRIGRLEQCHGGTIFLDEIGDMSHATQAKVLRILEDKSFERLGGNNSIRADVRLIAATNRDLEALIKENKFREDLYYRLNAMTIMIPPLRDRKEDIPQLVEYFLVKYNREFGKEIRRISPEALQTLQMYDWPGNVRELENVIKRAILLGKGSTLLPECVSIEKEDRTRQEEPPRQFQSALRQMVRQQVDAKKGSLYANVVEETEKILLIEVLKKMQGNQTQAAKLLGISRPTLKDKINKLGIRKEVHIQED
ncbi:MAG: sigma-54-dependent Fis family transcriptional regulator [Candidatus Omnitrophica bacterium]|nr:sigma-54-dependent Fis family transcriptional regulator [Candidatus Omnitrophota bacterium]